MIYGQQQARLPLVVVAGEGTLPHGKRLAPAIAIRLADNLHRTVSLLQEVLQLRASVFREELGTLKDYKAVIRVDSSVPQKFCKARSVPYALRAKVDQELDQLVAEGIACVFGVKRFHNYLVGRLFTLVTDHKPLVSLFNEQKATPAYVSAAHIQRWALTLAAY